MEAQDILLTFAEVSVALAGFIGIAAGVMAVVLLLLRVYQSRRRAILGSQGQNPGAVPFRSTMVVGYLVVTAAVALSSVFGVAVTGVYLVGVAVLLLAAAIEFLAFVAALQE